MNQFQGRVFVRVLASAAGAVAICTALASDPPDSKANPVSGYIEVTDSTHVGSNYDVRHAINPGNGQQLSVTMGFQRSSRRPESADRHQPLWRHLDRLVPRRLHTRGPDPQENLCGGHVGKRAACEPRRREQPFSRDGS